MNRHHQIVTRLVLAVAALVVFSFFSESARAQDSSSSSGAPTVSKKEKKTSLNFEDELVEGQTTKPELFYLFQKKNFNYKRLIRLRENFLPEMRKTSEDISRARSAN